MTGLVFHETMSGPFAMGVDTPQEGERVGRRTGWRLRLHSTVTIGNVDRFVADPQHTAALSGEIELPGITRRIPFRNGTFQLFVPSRGAGLRLMTYEAEFEHAGARHRFAGEKRVRDDFGFDLMPDTTTLHSRLYRNGDAVEGGGVLRIGLAGLARMIASMRAREAASPDEAARAMAVFGLLFGRNLREAYLSRPQAWAEAARRRAVPSEAGWER
ncbi:hypothetical protein [Planobispora takensis]|nr:hypothetical protein [Planobispora takensis]